MTHARRSPPDLVGRFVVELAGERRTGLTAGEVVEVLAGPEGSAAIIYRIHHVDDAGRMALVGVTPRTFQTDDCLVFRRREAASAREDFEAVRRAALGVAPPCRITAQLSEAPSAAAPHAVVLIFPAACSESVGHWLTHCRLRPGDQAEGGVHALRTYLDAAPLLLQEAVLEEHR